VFASIILGYITAKKASVTVAAAAAAAASSVAVHQFISLYRQQHTAHNMRLQ